MNFTCPESAELFSREHENIEKFDMKKVRFFCIVDPPEASLLKPPEMPLAYIVGLSNAHRMIRKPESETTTNTSITSVY